MFHHVRRRLEVVISLLRSILSEALGAGRWASLASMWCFMLFIGTIQSNTARGGEIKAVESGTSANPDDDEIKNLERQFYQACSDFAAWCGQFDGSFDPTPVTGPALANIDSLYERLLAAYKKRGLPIPSELAAAQANLHGAGIPENNDNSSTSEEMENQQAPAQDDGPDGTSAEQIGDNTKAPAEATSMDAPTAESKEVSNVDPFGNGDVTSTGSSSPVGGRPFTLDAAATKMVSEQNESDAKDPVGENVSVKLYGKIVEEGGEITDKKGQKLTSGDIPLVSSSIGHAGDLVEKLNDTTVSATDTHKDVQQIEKKYDERNGNELLNSVLMDAERNDRIEKGLFSFQAKTKKVASGYGETFLDLETLGWSSLVRDGKKVQDAVSKGWDKIKKIYNGAEKVDDIVNARPKDVVKARPEDVQNLMELLLNAQQKSITSDHKDAQAVPKK